MVLEKVGEPLVLREIDTPEPTPDQIRIRVSACGVCRTDLHVVEGDLTEASLPLILGHEIVGTVDALGDAVRGLEPGRRVGVPWLGSTCGGCVYCTSERENLCIQAGFTGYQIDGGYADYTLADPRFVLPIPDEWDDVEAAPLLCAGLIGYRSYRMTGEARRLGLYGFGAAAHLLVQIARFEGRELYAFTRPGDAEGQDFARELGTCWAGDSDALPPEPLDAAILFAPVGSLVPQALRALAPGGVVVCAGIHMSRIPAFDYSLLWGERQIRSVANLTRADGRAFFEIAARVPVRAETVRFPLKSANEALTRLRDGRIRGAAVLVTGA